MVWSWTFWLVCVWACPVCYLPVDEAIALMPKLPSPSPVLKNLAFIYEETLSRDGEFGGSDFGGYPTLRQRNESFDIRESMSVHYGYVSCFVWCFPSVYLWVLNKGVCGYNLFVSVIKGISPILLLTSFTFVRGSKPGRNIGFDMDEDDLVEMEQCHGVVAASAIFGLYYMVFAFI